MKTSLRLCLKSLLTCLCVASLSLVGCEKKQVVSERRPRPVVVKKLTQRLPPNSALVSASVASWKTEKIGFEVGGRVEWVVEPNTEITGRVLDKEGNLISKGTPIGRIETERYTLKVAKSKAEVARAKQNLISAQTELNESIPAQIKAAEANKELAKIEFERSQRLFQQKAGAKGDVDRDRSNYQSAISELKQLEASKKAKQAETESIRNSLLQAQQDLRDAERNLEDCTLYSSFNGQIAAVSVVPGSVVNSGSPVATVQMMDPIKIELEVSADESRRLQRTERLPVLVTMPDGSTKTLQGYLYLVDPVADPQTRTFTVTLLIMNEKVTLQQTEKVTASTNDIWRLDFKFLPGMKAGENKLFVEEKAILKDSEGFYLWMVTNATSESRDQGNRFFKVRKLRIELGERKIPYLGNWVFQQVTTNDATFNPNLNVVIGKLNVREGKPADWNGDTVYMDSENRWMLRPGDIVKVDLSGPNITPGFFVPMDAIIRIDGSSFIFVVEQQNGETIARKREVRIVDSPGRKTTSSLIRIEPLNDGNLEGLDLVTEGAHYLIDGEKIKALPALGVSQ